MVRRGGSEAPGTASQTVTIMPIAFWTFGTLRRMRTRSHIMMGAVAIIRSHIIASPRTSPQNQSRGVPLRAGASKCHSTDATAQRFSSNAVVAWMCAGPPKRTVVQKELNFSRLPAAKTGKLSLIPRSRCGARIGSLTSPAHQMAVEDAPDIQ